LVCIFQHFIIHPTIKHGSEAKKQKAGKRKIKIKTTRREAGHCHRSDFSLQHGKFYIKQNTEFGDNFSIGAAYLTNFEPGRMSQNFPGAIAVTLFEATTSPSVPSFIKFF